MPTSKSSISTIEAEQRAARKKTYEQWAAEGDYKALLNDLLAEIHRDGGQYTTLSGFSVSTHDAIDAVRLLRRKLSSMMFKRRRP